MFACVKASEKKRKTTKMQRRGSAPGVLIPTSGTLGVASRCELWSAFSLSTDNRDGRHLNVLPEVLKILSFLLLLSYRGGNKSWSVGKARVVYPKSDLGMLDMLMVCTTFAWNGGSSWMFVSVLYPNSSKRPDARYVLTAKKSVEIKSDLATQS